MNRKEIVRRHNPVITTLDALSPLSIGNGELGFSADFTGLQTFPDSYETPLGTQSNWGWHYTGGPGLYTDQDIVYQKFDTYGRQVAYPMKPEDKADAYHWLRQNPHRLQLGRISFRLLTREGNVAQVGRITQIDQKLDLWTGTLHSRFAVDGELVQVSTACHPEQDMIGVKVSSPLLADNRLQVFVRFPAPDVNHTNWSKAVYPDWGHDERHSTNLVSVSDHSAVLKRKMDSDGYSVRWDWNAGRLKQTGIHEFTLFADANLSNELEFTISFAPVEPVRMLSADEILHASARGWKAFWMSGGAVDLEGSSDPRAFELERRVVLSQYLCAIHSGGSLPPQETGLMYNSWFGKFHLEMHWWHAAHFPLWGRADKLMKSMGWYQSILPLARELALSQGYTGARWPKMVGFDGKQSPSTVAPGLIWQQPHPIALAELIYRADPSRETLERFRSIVFESADFMVSYAHWDRDKGVFDLGPPLIPSQECHHIHESKNPPYELEYWKYGLDIAATWAKRLNVEPNPRWHQVAASMAKPPQAGGVYLAHEYCPDTYTRKNRDHPSMTGAMGILPGSLIDPDMMRNTLIKVKDVWNWSSAWGWDFPMCAMTAARLGEREMAVDFLLMDETKNRYLTNGHNYQRPGLTAYLPGNGGLLTAVAMMACGWNGAAGDCPGFPRDGSWSVKWEGLHPIL
ncbi:glycoside hydrolase family 65 [Paenibacillus tarimensis]